MAEFEESAIVSKILDFNVDVNTIKIEVAVTANVRDEMLRGILSGAVEPEKSIPEFLNRLEAAGSDQILEEVEKQLKEWKKIKEK